MGYIRFIIEDKEVIEDITKTFSSYEEFDNYDDVEITFYGEKEDISEKYAEICKRHPNIKIDMTYDNDEEGFVTYYENDDGWGHECWIEQYDVEEL